MQLFSYHSPALLAFLVLAGTPIIAQQTEEKGKTTETEIIIITETIDEHGNKNVSKTIHKGNFTQEEIDKIVSEESVEEIHGLGEYEIKVTVDEHGAIHEEHGNESIFEHDGHDGGLFEEKHEGSFGHDKRGFLGVNIEDAEGQGVRITGIVSGSPAESAGIVSGDVIKAVNGDPVESTEELIKAIGNMGIGEEVEVTYARDGAPATVKVTLAERPESELDKALKEVDAFKWVEKPETDQKPRLGVYIESAEDGVKITEVSENSLAEAAGLKKGDIITSFNGSSVSSSSALIEAVQQSPIGEAVVVEFIRDGEKMKKTVTFE